MRQKYFQKIEVSHFGETKISTRKFLNGAATKIIRMDKFRQTQKSDNSTHYLLPTSLLEKDEKQKNTKVRSSATNLLS